MTAKPFCDGPFSTLKGTSWIVGKDHHGEPCHVLDQRGWGYLTGKGQSALGLDNATASAMQAETQQWVVDAMNAAWNRSAVQPAQVLETCGKCMGSGYGGHPDSGQLCADCNGNGGVEPHPDPRDEVIARLVDALRNCDGGLGALGVPRGAKTRSTARAALAAAKAVQHG